MISNEISQNKQCLQCGIPIFTEIDECSRCQARTSFNEEDTALAKQNHFLKVPKRKEVKPRVTYSELGSAFRSPFVLIGIAISLLGTSLQAWVPNSGHEALLRANSIEFNFATQNPILTAQIIVSLGVLAVWIKLCLGFSKPHSFFRTALKGWNLLLAFMIFLFFLYPAILPEKVLQIVNLAKPEASTLNIFALLLILIGCMMTVLSLDGADIQTEIITRGESEQQD